jgi:hypothetical protein
MGDEPFRPPMTSLSDRNTEEVMSNEVYGIWKDEMVQPNAGSQGTPDDPIIDVKASVKVPDGLWAVFAKIDVDNNSEAHQIVHLALRANTMIDRSVVKLAPNGKADHTSVPLMTLAHFPGTRTSRVNEIWLGLWDTGAPPDVKVGRSRIIAMRLNHFVLEPSPGTNNK